MKNDNLIQQRFEDLAIKSQEILKSRDNTRGLVKQKLLTLNYFINGRPAFLA